MKRNLWVLLVVGGAVLFQLQDWMHGHSHTSVASAAQAEMAEVVGVYFTPPAGAAAGVVNAIDNSRREVLVQAYTFTHNGIAQALLRAHRRGVSVRVLLDEKSHATNRYVIDLLSREGVALRGDGKHAIAHNKVMVIDDAVVVTGSFNFTNAAETRNAENLLILKSTDLAAAYKTQWQLHWDHGSAVDVSALEGLAHGQKKN